MLNKINHPNFKIGLATLLGLLAGFVNISAIDSLASFVSDIFINLLKLVSLPIIFLSVVSTASGMENISDIKSLGKRTLQYTLLTTIIAASVALIFFFIINPVNTSVILDKDVTTQGVINQGSYYAYLLKSIPSNIIQPFSENHVIGVLFIAILLSVAILSLPNNNRSILHDFFSSLYAAIMKVTTWIVNLMPLAIWAFITLFMKDFRNGLEIKSLALYLICVMAANLTQGALVLPLFLKWNKVSSLKLFWGMMPALSLAFFTKSSSAALPMAIKCAKENVNISPKVANFTLPLCTTINMNGCAAFILTTVLFVSMSNGVVFSTFEMILWVFIATIAAVGNAGVPMGCYFLSGAFLAAMDIPLNILGVILPFYTLIDMVESAINVWSDACVTAVVDKKVKEDIEQGLPEPEAVEININKSRCC